ncbi:MAG: NAD(P)H-dependent flavin oxidoreductase [Bacteriovoracaceae bacterium]
MSLPETLKGLRLPVVAAPMFLVSNDRLVIESCKNGVVGTFPALNQRTTDGFRTWVQEIKKELSEFEKSSGKKAAPFGVNLIAHKSNPRLEDDLKVCVEEKVPLIITSLGAVSELVDRVHSYGGIVFHDVTTLRHAQKAAEAGVDGLILVAGGAGGHAGRINPLALVGQVRKFFNKTILLAGSVSRGDDILAAEAMGADLAYIGTRFIATTESGAQPEYKQMILDAESTDIIYTPAVSGVPASFMKASLEKAGIKDFNDRGEVNFGDKLTLGDEAKAWKNIWSAGHGVANISEVFTVKDLVDKLESEYRAARKRINA